MFDESAAQKRAGGGLSARSEVPARRRYVMAGVSGDAINGELFRVGTPICTGEETAESGPTDEAPGGSFAGTC